jgi:hypothetical protein
MSNTDDAGRFDRVRRADDGSFEHSLRGEPVAGPGEDWKRLSAHDEPDVSRLIDVVFLDGTRATRQAYRSIDWTRVHDWRYTPTPLPVTGPAAAVEASSVLVALADLEKAAKASPANAGHVVALASQVRTALLQPPGALTTRELAAALAEVCADGSPGSHLDAALLVLERARAEGLLS